LLDGDLLNCVHKCRALLGMQSVESANTRDLAETMRHHLRHDRSIETARAHKGSTPETTELSQFLVKGHLSKQVLDSILN